MPVFLSFYPQNSKFLVLPGLIYWGQITAPEAKQANGNCWDRPKDNQLSPLPLEGCPNNPYQIGEPNGSDEKKHRQKESYMAGLAPKVTPVRPSGACICLFSVGAYWMQPI